MQNKYVIDIIQSIQETNYSRLMVIKGRLSVEEVNLINEVAAQYKKTVIFASMRDVVFNNNKNVLVAI